MSIELQTPAGDLHLQDEEKSDERLKNIEQEIECPRCNDIMTLSSNFDRLGYVCQECDLLLVMKQIQRYLKSSITFSSSNLSFYPSAAIEQVLRRIKRKSARYYLLYSRILFNYPSLEISSSPDAHSEAIERTVVLTKPEDMIKTSLRIYTHMSEYMDAICDDKGVQVTINTKPIWEGMHVLKRRGVKLRWITNITKENLDWCKEFMKIIELRHLDRIEGAFGIHDGKYYMASANVTRESKTFPGELIVSSVKVIIQQQQQIFSLLWDKAIPAKQRIKEIEQGLKREFIDIIRDPVDIKKLIFNLVKSASDQISILLSSANAFHLLEREGLMKVIREASSEHNVNIRILVDVRKQDDLKEIEEKLKSTRQSQSITFQPVLKSSFQTKITTLIVDSTYSLTVEMKDKVESFDESVGLATYSNSESNIDTYTSIFETLWMQNEYSPNTSQLNRSKV